MAGSPTTAGDAQDVPVAATALTLAENVGELAGEVQRIVGVRR
jgi:hypothetical protein